MTDDTLTVKDLMSRWRCTRQTILRAISEGRLAAFRVGVRIFRVRLDEVERFEAVDSAKVSAS